jgi:hypothetical protein
MKDKQTIIDEQDIRADEREKTLQEVRDFLYYHLDLPDLKRLMRGYDPTVGLSAVSLRPRITGFDLELMRDGRMPDFTRRTYS